MGNLRSRLTSSISTNKLPLYALVECIFSRALGYRMIPGMSAIFSRVEAQVTRAAIPQTANSES